MAYLKKQITTGHNVICDTWKINIEVSANNANDLYIVKGNIGLYLNEQAMLDKKVILDNVAFVYNDMTLAEIDGLAVALQSTIARIMQSKIVDEVETNVFQTSHSGQVSFQDATVHL